MQRRYRLHHDVLGLTDRDGRLRGQTIPASSIVTIEREDEEDSSLVEVAWNGRKALIFRQDLEQRAHEEIRTLISC
jgi:hypothetical protein